MSNLLYTGKTFSGQPERRAAVPPSRLLIDVNAGNIINDGSATITSSATGSYSLVTPAARDTTLDTVYSCEGTSSQGVSEQGKLIVTATVLGTWITTVITASAITVTTSIFGNWNEGIGTSDSVLGITITLKPNSDFIPFTSGVKTNWVKWSNIGSISFTQGKSNVAGERPLDWKGTVYAVKKLFGKIVVYGDNGVSFLSPSGILFGLNTIYRIGLKGKNAVAGDETKHFFIDNSGKLWKLTDTMKKLDYSEYLNSLTANVVMSYDNLNNLIYICDGSVGYVYDTVTDSLGRCSPNITGIGYQSGTQYVAASSAITTDPFEICTDIYDLGVRAGKTVFSLELGINLSTDLYAAIDYRRDIAGSFTQTPWYIVSSIGRVFITAWGREFRFRVKTLSYEDFELDYIKINGVNDVY